MLAYFPAIYPDELLYSIFARYHRHRGSSSPSQTAEELFGRPHAIASIDFPGHLSALSHRLPRKQRYDPDELIAQHTLVPYLTAYSTMEQREKVVEGMKQRGTEGLALMLGLVASRVVAPKHLRYCVTCQADMMTRCGELYWRRCHQLPGVLVCPDHGDLLHESSVDLTLENRHAYIAAHIAVCPMEEVIRTISDSAHQTVWALARRSAALLTEGSLQIEPRNPSEVPPWRLQLIESGYAHGQYIDRAKLHDGLMTFYAAALPWLRAVAPLDDTWDWLDSLCRAERHHMHPFYHVMLDIFLTAQSIKPNPFGQGPWPCLNPLEPHHGELRIYHVDMHLNHGHRVGVFACDCGYIYTKWINAQGVVSSPRPLRYGSRFHTLLKELHAQNCSLRETARQLHVDPKTVTRECLLSSAGGVVVATGISVKSPSSRQARSKHFPPVHHNRVNWNDVDEKMCVDLTIATANLLRIKPPMRVTQIALERMINRVGWLGKRLHHLPRVKGLLSLVMESTAAFQIRRVYWAAEEITCQGLPLVAWQLRRMANLRENIDPSVEREVLRLTETKGRLDD